MTFWTQYFFWKLPTNSVLDISARDISAWTFHHWEISARACFGPAEVSAHGHFVSMDVLTQGHFGMGTFWNKEFLAPWTFWHGIFRHLNILAHGYFGTLQSNIDISAQTCWHLSYCAKMSMWRNVHGAEKSLCPKVPVLKSPCTETSTETKCPCAVTPTWPKRAYAEMSQWWNVCTKMSLVKILGAEMVGSLFEIVSGIFLEIRLLICRY